MNIKDIFRNTKQEFTCMKEASDYWTDAGQRSVLFMDILRKRGNIYLEHQQKGQPPVLTFDYKIIVDGRSMKRPVNHDLIRIIPEKGFTFDQKKRPIVIIDPRAGHGPGIGGSKRDSEIGMALKEGHPVYFLVFYPEPCPGQTLADVEQAEISFIKEVKKRHPNAEDPAVIGNCQAGWAVALLSADRPDVTGPVVLNGSPLSYWAGVEGENPMRYKGGLLGGMWLVSLLSDLGNGKFDGANLVANFEGLNPANTYWSKQYNVWSKVDAEGERYLNFEKWWNGYFIMTAEEIRFIVSNLFMGNKLEKGQLEVNQGEKIDLKNLEDPVVVFASKGDNITPPQQALNWIANVYSSVEEIKRHQQVIIYRVHEKIGHLGIFVSAGVAKKEHHEIIRSIDMIDYLPPGLYEMVITDENKNLPVTDYNVRFVEREISDILAFDDGQEDEASFPAVAAISEKTDKFYRSFVSPWVRMGVTEFSAQIMRQLHPLRMSRYSFSDQNPFLFPIKTLAPIVRQNRQSVSANNPFLIMEGGFSDGVTAMLNYYRDIRDTTQELIFRSVYDNPWMKSLFPESEKQETTPPQGEQDKREKEGAHAGKEVWLGAMEKGGFAEGAVRIMVAMASADEIIDRRELIIGEKIVKANKRLRKIKPSDFKQMVKDQSGILEADEDRAINSLARLLPTSDDRAEALEIARGIADADFIRSEEEEVLMEKIKKALEL